WLRNRTFVLRDAAGAPCRLVGTSEDVTERKQGEDRYRQIVGAAEEGIWLVDSNWVTTFVNARMARMLGCRPEEVGGRTVLDFIRKEDRPVVRERMRQPEAGVREVFESRFRRADGTELWTLCATNPVMDEAGRFAGALAMVTDISKRKQAEEALQLKDLALE